MGNSNINKIDLDRETKEEETMSNGRKKRLKRTKKSGRVNRSKAKKSIKKLSKKRK